jgi:hypothetical protein
LPMERFSKLRIAATWLKVTCNSEVFGTVVD